VARFSSLSNKNKTLILKLFIHLSALTPLVYFYYLAFNDGLGADPVEAIIHFTGIGAFNLLLITLLVSPLAKKFKQAFLMNVRRLLGLYAFAYALCHLLNFLAFEVQFNLTLFFGEVIKRPYITIGMAAFVLLSLLAVTSVNFLKKKMGRTWQMLHNFTYVISVLVAIHFYWSVKSEIIEPGIYIVLVIVLLGFRGKKIRRWLSG
jgi:sulfoxide reductase heme-binding subunit YedZ